MGEQATQITAVPAVRVPSTPVPQRVPPRPVRLPGVRARLTVGAVADPFEREADRMADHVMSVLRRMPLDPAGHHDEADGGETSRIQRRADSSAHGALFLTDCLANFSAEPLRRGVRVVLGMPEEKVCKSWQSHGRLQHREA